MPGAPRTRSLVTMLIGGVALLLPAACGGDNTGGASVSSSTIPTTTTTTPEPTAPSTTAAPESEYLEPLSGAFRAAMFNIGFPLHAEDAECMAREAIADLGNAGLRRLGSPSELSAEVRSEGIDRLTEAMSLAAMARLAKCIGPAHRLEFYLGGSWGDTRLSTRSEACLRDLDETDVVFHETFLDPDAVPPTWELQTEKCLRAGGDADAIAALFGEELPSHAPAFVYEPGGLRQWWPGGRLVGCGTAHGSNDQTGVVSVDLLNRSVILLGPSMDYSCLRASVAPGGEAVVYELETGAGLRIIDVSERTSARLDTGTVRDAGSPDWSPDGRWIAFEKESNSDIFIIRPDGSELTRVGTGMEPQWSSDSSSLLVQSADWDGIEVIDVAGRTQRRLIPDAVAATWSPTGDLIAYIADEHLGLWSVDGGDLGLAEGLRTATITETYAPAWSPDGRWVLVTTYEYDAVIIDTQDGTVHRIARTGTDPDTDVNWVPEPPTTSEA